MAKRSHLLVVHLVPRLPWQGLAAKAKLIQLATTLTKALRESGTGIPAPFYEAAMRDMRCQPRTTDALTREFQSARVELEFQADKELMAADLASVLLATLSYHNPMETFGVADFEQLEVFDSFCLATVQSGARSSVTFVGKRL